MEYRPVPSVTAARAFSIRTGLAASTITPGNTAPDASFTRPASDACAKAANGTLTTSASARRTDFIPRMRTPPWPARRYPDRVRSLTEGPVSNTSFNAELYGLGIEGTGDESGRAERLTSRHLRSASYSDRSGAHSRSRHF